MLSSFDQITYGSFIAFPYYYQFIRVKPPVISSKTHWYIIILHTRLINQQVQRSRVCILRHLKICRARPRLLSINARALLRYASWKSQRTSIANEKAWLLFHIRYHEKGCFSHLFQMVLALRKGRFVIKHRTKMENDILLDIYKERNW